MTEFVPPEFKVPLELETSDFVLERLGRRRLGLGIRRVDGRREGLTAGDLDLMPARVGDARRPGLLTGLHPAAVDRVVQRGKVIMSRDEAEVGATAD